MGYEFVDWILLENESPYVGSWEHNTESLDSVISGEILDPVRSN
jgi:hypothetical protein